MENLIKMGNMCSANSAQAVATTGQHTTAAPLHPASQMKPVSTTTGGNEPWRSLLLGAEVLVKSVHPHNLKKFKSKGDEAKDSARKIKSAGN